MTVTQSVQRGAALLDDRKPGWYTQIMPVSLDLNSTDRCVLGQVYGDFSGGLIKLGLAREVRFPWDVVFHMVRGSKNSFSHGFMGWPGEHTKQLEDAWRAEIAARRMKDFQREMELQRRQEAARRLRMLKKPSLTSAILTTLATLFV